MLYCRGCSQRACLDAWLVPAYGFDVSRAGASVIPVEWTLSLLIKEKPDSDPVIRKAS